MYCVKLDEHGEQRDCADDRSVIYMYAPERRGSVIGGMEC